MQNLETKDDKVTVLSIERGNDLKYLEKLGLRGDQFYYKIERVRETNGVTYIYHNSYIPEQYINANYPNLEYYSSIYTRFKLDYHIHMNDEHFEEINEIVFPTPEHAASILGIDTKFPTVFQTKTTQLEATGQVLEYIELINVLISTKLNSSLVTVITNFKNPEATVSGFLYTHYSISSLP